MSDSNETVFTRSAGLGSYNPEAPPEHKGSITAFGFPAVMKRLHRSIRSCVNRIPDDPQEDGSKLRDMFLKCITMKSDERAYLDELTYKLGESTAREDLLQRRITQMSPVDFIADPATATPDQRSVKEVRDELLRPDRERFAKVLPTPGRASTNEWDFIDEEQPSHGF